jgi:hypothetical protein
VPLFFVPLQVQFSLALKTIAQIIGIGIEIICTSDILSVKELFHEGLNDIDDFEPSESSTYMVASPSN